MRRVVIGRGSGAQEYRNVKPALREVLEGNWQRGKKALLQFSALNDPDAHPALGYIAAYEGDWSYVLNVAERIVGDTGTHPGLNLHLDFAALTARAADQTGDWNRLGKIARRLTKLSSPLARQLRVCVSARADRFNTCVGLSDRKQKAEARSWAEYVAGGDERRPKHARKNEKTRRGHDFSVAGAFHQWPAVLEMMQKYPELPYPTGSAAFEWTTEAVQWALSRDPPVLTERRAWDLLFHRLDRWIPVLECEVLPASLVTMDGVRELMTPGRCRKILAAPKGLWD